MYLRAEQALRRAKLHMKIARYFRTRSRAEHLDQLQGLMETARKRLWNLLDLLQQTPDAAALQPNPIQP